jgi:mono/diheme cytochrome c family protein
MRSLDSGVVAVAADGRLVASAQGQATVLAESEEGGFQAQLKVTVGAPSFAKNILPIVAVKCAPCHAPGQTFDFQDSSVFALLAERSLDRLQRDPSAPGRMPVRGAPAGDLAPEETALLLAWLKTKVVPLKGIAVRADSLLVDQHKAPVITYTPANASNKAYVLASLDTAKVAIDGLNYVGRAAGQAAVQVRALDGNFVDTLIVKVKPIPVDSIVMRDTLGAVGDTLIPRVQVFPAKAAVKTYALSLLRPSSVVAIVAAGRGVVGLAAGKDTVVATATDGGKKTRMVYTVGPVMPRQLSVADANGAVGVPVAPVLTWAPDNTTNKAHTFSVHPGDTAIAAVVAGRLQGKALGKARVTAIAKADTSVRDVFIFTVGPVAVTGIGARAAFLHPGDSVLARPFVSFLPANATNRGFQLKSSLPAKVRATGDSAVVALKLGPVPITVTSKDGGKEAEWKVTVIRPRFTGAVKNLTAAKCIACHSPTAYPSRNWQDSAQVVEFRSRILARIAATDGTRMPPPGSPALTPAEIDVLEAWLALE